MQPFRGAIRTLSIVLRYECLSMELEQKQKAVCQILVSGQFLTPPVALGSALGSLDHCVIIFFCIMQGQGL